MLQQIADEEIQKEKETIKGIKEQEFLQGDIYSDDSYSNYHPNSSYKVNRKFGFKYYEPFKASLNPLAKGHVDLILTGQFVNAMVLPKSNDGKYIFGNTDKKRNILVEMYGENIFGLNQNVFSKFQKDIIAPRFITNIKKNAKIA